MAGSHQQTSLRVLSSSCLPPDMSASPASTSGTCKVILCTLPGSLAACCHDLFCFFQAGRAQHGDQQNMEPSAEIDRPVIVVNVFVASCSWIPAVIISNPPELPTAPSHSLLASEYCRSLAQHFALVSMLRCQRLALPCCLIFSQRDNVGLVHHLTVLEKYPPPGGLAADILEEPVCTCLAGPVGIWVQPPVAILMQRVAATCCCAVHCQCTGECMTCRELAPAILWPAQPSGVQGGCVTLLVRQSPPLGLDDDL